MSFSLHDAEIVAYSVDLENKEIRLKVDYLERENVNNEWKIKCEMQGEVIFHNVMAHEFRDCRAQNVIFDIEECPFDKAIENYYEESYRVLESFWFDIKDNPLKVQKYAQENNIHAFFIDSSIGLLGIIFAEKMEKKIL